MLGVARPKRVLVLHRGHRKHGVGAANGRSSRLGQSEVAEYGRGPSRPPCKRSAFEDCARLTFRETADDQPAARSTSRIRDTHTTSGDSATLRRHLSLVRFQGTLFLASPRSLMDSDKENNLIRPIRRRPWRQPPMTLPPGGATGGTDHRGAKSDAGPCPLPENATVVVVGGGPAGSFFAIRLLRTSPARPAEP